jgi:hypothetical protein
MRKVEFYVLGSLLGFLKEVYSYIGLDVRLIELRFFVFEVMWLLPS